MFYVQKLLPENRAVYEIMCKIIAEPDRPQMTVRTKQHRKDAICVPDN